MDISLRERLEAYNRSDYYPFHMPGHKRNPVIDGFPVGMDITEIDGFDNLHCAEGVLKDAQRRAAHLYGADESFYLVNGSTSGILAAVSAAVTSGGRLLMARNCHKAAYHAAFLRNLSVEYLYPEVIPGYGICGGIRPDAVEEALRRYPDIQAVLLTSPTYEGMVSNIQEIADIVHRERKLLIVDEAHGAHLGIVGGGFPESALNGGADIVIQSLHKTLPSLTQTAILHVQGPLADRGRLKRYLQIYQTSSPSYVFMAGMDSCIRLLETDGEELFRQFRQNLDYFYRETEDLKVLHVLKPEEVEGMWGIRAMDASKLCIVTGVADETADGRMSERTGVWLQETLREEYHLEMEMAAAGYVLGMTSVMDSREGFERLSGALKELDGQMVGMQAIKCAVSPQDASQTYKMHRVEAVMTAAQAENLEEEVCLLRESAGRISKEYRYVYPPGIPLVVPGERISDEILKCLKVWEDADLNILGQEVGPTGEQWITVVKE